MKISNTDYEALMHEEAKKFYDNFLNYRHVILMLLDNVLGSGPTPLQKLNSIRAFVKSEDNIRKSREVIEYIKSKASQNVYYRKAYQVLKEKELQ